MAKHYDALEYTKEDEKEPIVHFQYLKETRKMMLPMPSIPLTSVNLVATSSQVKILHVEEEHVQEQTYPMIVVQKGGAHHNDVQEDEELQEMVTFQPNS